VAAASSSVALSPVTGGVKVSHEGLDAVTYGRMEKAIRFLEENVRAQPTLEELAAHIGMSPFHLQRLFRAAVGVSPKRFLQFVTSVQARGLLAERGSVLEAAWGSGLSGPGRLHDLMVNVHAMTPAEVREQGRGVELRWGIHETPVGACVLAASPRGVSVLEFLDSEDTGHARARVRARWPEAALVEDRNSTADLVGRIFHGGGDTPISLDVRGTNFQIRVWEALLRVPWGAVVTYGRLAERMGLPKSSARALGQAVGANPVAVLIPCHRVLRATGALGGYRWGTERKVALLAREDAERGVA
jgi:AraC family transcriptional regulator of adaptative response/methylated-DNA-[protein]-cysteine methyltransferase